MRIGSLLRPLASLRLTVALFAMAMFLIFAGTLAQVERGVWEVMDRYFRSIVAWVDLQLFVPRGLARTSAAIPFPGGFAIAGLMVVNLIAAHVVRWRLNPARIGIILLHAGVIVLLLGEFVTGLASDEGAMSIREGQRSNFIEDSREAELAIVDSSGPTNDRVTVVPESMLVRAARTGERIEHPDLPFAVKVETWMPNSQLARAEPGRPEHGRGGAVATAGLGALAVAVETPKVSGVDGSRVNAPSAYVTLTQGNTTLGTWLVSLQFDRVQTVNTSDGERYDLALRFRRTYKPYTLHLIDFRHDKFVGTETPRNFSSHLRLTDPSRGTDREVLISMNDPLRYRGETFYQSAFMEGDSGTILQVVRNPGWLMPYVACAMVTTGLLVHFGGSLRRSLRRRAVA